MGDFTLQEKGGCEVVQLGLGSLREQEGETPPQGDNVQACWAEVGGVCPDRWGSRALLHTLTGH